MISLFRPARARRGVRLASLVVASGALVVPVTAFAAPSAHDCVAASEDSLALRKQDKLAATRDKLLVCSDPACPAEVRDECAHRMSEVTSAIPSVVFEVKDAAGNDVSAVRVTMDGALLVDHLGGAGVNVDPGEHTFRFELDKAQAQEKKFVIREGEKNRHLVITFAPAAAPSMPAPPATAPPTAATPAPPAETSPPPSSGGGSPLRTIGLVTGAVGIVAMGVGGYFGLQAIGSNNDSNSNNHCIGDACDAAGKQSRNDAISAGNTSTILFVVGGVLTAGGIVLFLVGGSSSAAESKPAVAATPTVGPGSAGFALSGRF